MLKLVKRFENGVVSWDFFHEFLERQNEIYDRLRFLANTGQDSDDDDQFIAFGMIRSHIEDAGENLREFDERSARELEASGGKSVKVFDEDTEMAIKVIMVLNKSRKDSDNKIDKLNERLDALEMRWDVANYDKIKNALKEAIIEKVDDAEEKPIVTDAQNQTISENEV